MKPWKSFAVAILLAGAGLAGANDDQAAEEFLELPPLRVPALPRGASATYRAACGKDDWQTSAPVQPTAGHANDSPAMEALPAALQAGFAPPGVSNGCTDPEAADLAQPPAASKVLGLVGGAGVYYVQPLFGSNPALFTTTSTINPAGTVATTPSSSREFDWGFSVTPRVWLGYAFDDAWTLRARYWRFHNSPEEVAVVHPFEPTATTLVATVGALPIVATPVTILGTAPDVIGVNSSLHLDVFDFEMARALDRGCWSFEGSAGVRYAELKEHYGASLVNPGTPALGFTPLTALQDETNKFHGAGPTLAGDVSCQLGAGFCLYADARGALLYGRSRQDATQAMIGASPPLAAPLVLFTADNARDVLLPVGELELGAGWGHDLGSSRWLLKAGFAAQWWPNAGSASIPAGGVFPSVPSFGPAVAAPVAAATASDLAFVGLTLTLGVRY